MARNKDWNLILSEYSDNFTTLVDEVDATTTYIGKAAPGTSTSAARWQIYKVSIVSTVTTIAYAGGDDAFNQVWDDRASLSYS